MLLVDAILCAAIATASSVEDDAHIAAQIADLRRDIAELRASISGDGAWLDAARANEVRQLVKDVLADASTRTSLADDGAVVGWDGNHFLGCADGTFKLILRGWTQIRFSFDQRPSVQGLPGASESTWGFDIRRQRLIFEGFVVDPTWRFKAEIITRPGDSPSLLDSYIEKAFSDQLVLRVGQFKVPFNREHLFGVTTTQFLERSSVDTFFTPARAQGMQLTWIDEDFSLSGAMVNGFEVRSNYFNSGSMRNLSWTSDKVAEYAFAARAEWKIGGTWVQNRDSIGFPGQDVSTLIGIAGEVEKKSNNQGVPATLGNLNPFVVAATADIGIKGSGASIFAWAVWRQVAPGQSGLANSNQFGAVVQGGYFIAPKVEAILRYEYGDADTAPNGEAPTLAAMPSNNGYEALQAVTVGCNWYIDGHRLKISSDIGYAFTGIGAFAFSNGAFLEDGTSNGKFDSSGQILARVQLQVMF